MAGSHATHWPMLLALPYYLRVSKNTFLFLSGSTMLNDIHKLSLTVYGNFFHISIVTFISGIHKKTM